MDSLLRYTIRRAAKRLLKPRTAVPSCSTRARVTHTSQSTPPLHTNRYPDPLGLIRLADDECLCPEGSGRSFVDKLLLAAADDQEQRHNLNYGAGRGVDGVKIEGGGGGGCKDTVQFPGTMMWAGIEREESPGVAGRGAASGGGDGGSSAWPVYTDMDNFDGRSTERCVFHIRHFVGERKRRISRVRLKSSTWYFS